MTVFENLPHRVRTLILGKLECSAPTRNEEHSPRSPKAGGTVQSMVERYIALTLRPTHSDRRSEHYQVYSGEVRIGTIYHTRTRPDGKEWFWGINGVLHGPLVFNGFAMTLDDARRELADNWARWLAAAKLSELEAAVTRDDAKPS